MQINQRFIVATIVTAISADAARAQSPVQLQHETAHAQAAPQSVQRPSTAPPQRRSNFRYSSVQQAWQSAVTSKRPLIVMFTSDSCRYCTKMLNETYGHPAIQQMLSIHTETVLAHADSNKALIEKLGIRAYPTSLIVSPQGKIVGSIEGYVAPQAFFKQVEPLLRRMQANPPASSASVSQAPTSNGRG